MPRLEVGAGRFGMAEELAGFGIKVTLIDRPGM
jgi:hypothetical protein